MLTKLTVRNFKSLADVTIEFPRLTVLFGPNAAGKSNLLDAIQTLSRIGTQRTLSDALSDPVRGHPVEAFTFPTGGLSELLSQREASFSLDSRVATRKETCEYRIEVRIHPGSGRLATADEYLALLNTQGESKGRPPIERHDESTLDIRRRSKGRPRQEPLGLNYAVLSDLRLGGPEYPWMERTREELNSTSSSRIKPMRRLSVRSYGESPETRRLMRTSGFARLAEVTRECCRSFVCIRKSSRRTRAMRTGGKHAMDAKIAGLLRREVTTLVFDQYGTIVDMQGGLTAAVAQFLAGKGWTGDPHRFVTWWRRTHFEDSMIDSLCDRGHTSYRQIGHRAVANVMRRSGIEYTHEEVRWLVALIERLKPFPDVLDALEQLRRRYRLAILSNGDPDMLEAARPHIGFEFDARISVEEAGYFKPHHATYAKACERLGVNRSSVLFVANHAFDCIGAKAYGMRTAFIDRRRRPFGDTPHQPDLIVEDFAALARAMAD